MDTLLFQSFASGSSGNCYYIGTRQQGILIDAGISARQIRRNLRALGLDFSNLWGVLVTHDHADHIRGVGSLGEKHHLPIYATHMVHDGIDHNYGMTEKLLTSRKFVEKDVPFELAGMRITPFGISHDSYDCVGYYIEYKDIRFTLATDVGCTNQKLADYVQRSNYVVMEANYDEQMLLNGPYPKHLKSRIISDTGHLENVACGRFLAENYRPCLKSVFLCHLSKENNQPDLACDTVQRYLEAKNVHVGSDIQLSALARIEPSPLCEWQTSEI